MTGNEGYRSDEEVRITRRYRVARKAISGVGFAGIATGAIVASGGFLGGMSESLRDAINPYNDNPEVISYKNAGKRIADLREQRKGLEFYASLQGIENLNPELSGFYDELSEGKETIDAEINVLADYRNSVRGDSESEFTKYDNWNKVAISASALTMLAGTFLTFVSFMGSISLSETLRKRKDRKIADLKDSV